MSNTALKEQSEALLAGSRDGEGGDPPERAKIRGSLAALLYAAGFLILSLSSCGDGEKKQKDELETLRQALNAQLSAYVLCTTTPTETTFPGALVSNTGSDDDEFWPGLTEEEWGNDLGNLPTAAKPFAWKNYTLELMGGNTGPHYNAYSWSNGVKTKVSQLNCMSGSIIKMSKEGIVLTDSGIFFQLIDQGGVVSVKEVGPTPIGGKYVVKDGYFLTRYNDGGTRFLRAIKVDPNNAAEPVQTAKLITIPSDGSYANDWGIDYDDEEKKLIVSVGKGYRTFNSLPEGVDWMDNFQTYMGEYTEVGTSVPAIKTVKSYTFTQSSEEEILIIHPDGTKQTIHKDDFGGGLFKNIVKTSIGISIRCATGQLITAEIMGDGGINVYPDPGAHTSEVEECSELELSEEQVETMFTKIPDPTEPDSELNPETSPEPDEDTSVPPDQDAKDGSATDDGSNPDADVPPLDSADGLDAIDPDITDPDADAKPGDTKPEDLPQPEVKPDAEDANPDQDAQPGETTPDQKLDGKTPDEGFEDTEADASIPPEQTSDQNPGEDVPMNLDDSIQPADPGCSCATTEPRKPQGLKGQVVTALIALSTLLKLKGRRKEDEI